MPRFDTLDRVLRALRHHMVLQPLPEPDGGDVALAEWFLSLSLEERIDAWEGWLALVDQVEVAT